MDIHQQMTTASRQNAPETDARAASTPVDTLSETQETAVILLSKNLMLALDDLASVIFHLFNADISRQAIANCLKQNNVSDLRNLQFIEADGSQSSRQRFNKCDPGFFCVNVETLPKLSGESQPSFLFIAIDRATHWLYVECLPAKTADGAAAFLSRLIKNSPFKVTQIVTENSDVFGQPPAAEALQEPAESCSAPLALPSPLAHPFFLACSKLDIKQRFFNSNHSGYVAMATHHERVLTLLDSAHVHSDDDLQKSLIRFQQDYHEKIPQTSLGNMTPAQSLNEWKKKKPLLFKKKTYRLTARDIGIIAFLWFGTALYFASLAHK